MGKARQEVRITNVSIAREKPNYNRMAGELLATVRAFYQDPENEKAYQEWRKEHEDH